MRGSWNRRTFFFFETDQLFPNFWKKFLGRYVGEDETSEYFLWHCPPFTNLRKQFLLRDTLPDLGYFRGRDLKTLYLPKPSFFQTSGIRSNSIAYLFPKIFKLSTLPQPQICDSPGEEIFAYFPGKYLKFIHFMSHASSIPKSHRKVPLAIPSLCMGVFFLSRIYCIGIVLFLWIHTHLRMRVCAVNILTNYVICLCISRLGHS